MINILTGPVKKFHDHDFSEVETANSLADVSVLFQAKFEKLEIEHNIYDILEEKFPSPNKVLKIPDQTTGYQNIEQWIDNVIFSYKTIKDFSF